MKTRIFRMLIVTVTVVVLGGLNTRAVFPGSEYSSKFRNGLAAPRDTIVLLSGSYVYEAPTTLADIDGDGKLEIIIGGRTLNPDGSLGCSGVVYVYRPNGSLMWQATVRADINSGAAAYDLNGDGYKDIIVGMGGFQAPGETAETECGKGNPNAAGNGGVIALNGKDGSTLWTFNTQDWGEWGKINSVLDGVWSTPAVGDMLGNGKVEIAFGAWDDCIYLLDSQGNPLWGEIPFTTPQGFCGRKGFFEHDTVWSSPALADVDSDGQLEVIIGGDVSCTVLNDPNLCNRYNVPSGGFLWVIKYDGTVLARRWFDQAMYSSPAIADLNNDGKLEIVVGTGQAFSGKGYYVIAMHLDTTKPVTESLVTNWQTSVVGRTLSSPAVGDLNGDGVLDVVQIIKYGDWGTPVGPAANNGSYVYAFRGDNGTVLWQTHACTYNDSIGRSFPIGASPVLADIAGSGRPNVIFPHAWEIAVLNSDGTYYTKTNRANGCTGTSGNALFAGNGTFSATVAVGDLLQNGMASIVAPGRWDENNSPNRGALYIWTLASVGDKPWPMFHRDEQHTGRAYIGPPRLAVRPTSINVMYQFADPANEQVSIQVLNAGDGFLTWSGTPPAGVTLTPGSGTAGTSTVTVTISTAGRSIATHNLGNIAISGTSGGNPVSGSPASIPVTLTVVNQLYKIFLPLGLR